MSLMSNLLRNVVDYAGLFPPASLELETVVQNYSAYLRSDERAMLGRLIVPAMQLTELESLGQDLAAGQENSPPWQISALIPPIDESTGTRKFDAALEAIEKFNRRNQSANGFNAMVDALEVRVDGVEATRATIERLPTGISCFLEDPNRAHPELLIEQISQVTDGRAPLAKIRMGGVTPELIPPPDDVARFISSCAKHDVGFKATAGLHHPIRGQFRLTYENDAPTSLMFGYLNVFVATMIAFEHFASEKILVEILANQDATRFVFDDQQLSWNNLHVSRERVAEFRKRAIISFGSCSFMEPTSELVQVPGISHESVFSQ